jgi:hypothetical protein
MWALCLVRRGIGRRGVDPWNGRFWQQVIISDRVTVGSPFPGPRGPERIHSAGAKGRGTEEASPALKSLKIETMD